MPKSLLPPQTMVDSPAQVARSNLYEPCSSNSLSPLQFHVLFYSSQSVFALAARSVGEYIHAHTPIPSQNVIFH